MKTAPSSRRLDILNGALLKRCG
jgi:hypothetical protein